MTDEKSLVELNNELEKVKKAIKEAKIQEEIILKKISEHSGLTFEEKFAYWYHNSEKRILPFLPLKNRFPNLRKFLDEHACVYDRHEIEDFINGDGTLAQIMCEVASPEECKGDNTRGECFKTDEECFAVLKEVMDGNIGGYTNDW